MGLATMISPLHVRVGDTTANTKKIKTRLPHEWWLWWWWLAGLPMVMVGVVVMVVVLVVAVSAGLVLALVLVYDGDISRRETWLTAVGRGTLTAAQYQPVDEELPPSSGT